MMIQQMLNIISVEPMPKLLKVLNHSLKQDNRNCKKKMLNMMNQYYKYSRNSRPENMTLLWQKFLKKLNFLTFAGFKEISQSNAIKLQ